MLQVLSEHLHTLADALQALPELADAAADLEEGRPFHKFLAEAENVLEIGIAQESFQVRKNIRQQALDLVLRGGNAVRDGIPDPGKKALDLADNAALTVLQEFKQY